MFTLESTYSFFVLSNSKYFCFFRGQSNVMYPYERYKDDDKRQQVYI